MSNAKMKYRIGDFVETKYYIMRTPAKIVGYKVYLGKILYDVCINCGYVYIEESEILSKIKSEDR